MCYEFDEFVNRARIAEQLRRQAKRADKQFAAGSASVTQLRKGAEEH